MIERLEIAALGNGVGGVARPDGAPVTFVRGALPGETVLCEITRTTSRWREAALVEVVSASPDRIEPPCPCCGRCGGCPMMHLSYGGQLEWKREWLSAALARSGCEAPVPLPAVPSPLETGYRNRVSFAVERGMLNLHEYRGGLTPVDDCLLLHDPGRAILGDLRHALGGWTGKAAVRTSFLTGRTLVELEGRGDEPCPAVPGVDVWTGPSGRTEPSREGAAPLVEEIAGCRIEVPPGGFFQVNTPAASIMALRIREELTGTGRLLDLYAGAGALSLPLASAGWDVTCVETCGRSVESGRRSAAEAGIDRVEFVRADAGAFLASVGGHGAFDAVMADPPRTGLGPGVAAALAALGAETVVMVSCNPHTLARDLSALSDAYSIDTISIHDMFPQTDHVETVTILSGRQGR